MDAVVLHISAAPRYLAMVDRARTNECSALTAAVLRGLGTQVPVHVLSLFTWEELELMVCGNPTVDVELLKVRRCAFI